MTPDGSGYRRTPEYSLVYSALASAARTGSQVFHTEVAEILGASRGEPGTVGEVGRLLTEISEDEHLAGRPMLGAVVLTGKGIPGDVFFSAARRLGKLASSDPAEEMTFWMAERRRVYDHWTSAEAR